MDGCCQDCWREEGRKEERKKGRVGGWRDRLSHTHLTDGGHTPLSAAACRLQMHRGVCGRTSEREREGGGSHDTQESLMLSKCLDEHKGLKRQEVT